MRGLSEHAARRAASVQRSSATSVRTVSEDPALCGSSVRRPHSYPCPDPSSYLSMLPLV